MKGNKKICLMLVFLLLASTALSACAQQSTAVVNAASNADENIINEESMFSTIKELSSEKYEGRLVGTKENEMAAQFIADQFKAIGLENPKGIDNYLQNYNTQVLAIKEEPILQLEDSKGNVVKSFKYSEDFLFRALSSSPEIDIKAPVFKLGSIEEMSTRMDSLKGKIALFPVSVNHSTTTAELIKYFMGAGALAGIGEFDTRSEERKYSRLTATPMRGIWMMGKYDPYLIVNNDTFSDISNAAERNLILHIKCDFSQDFQKQVPNVVGTITGSDPELKNEYIIIGAHFDHVGDNKNGTYNPGALDNASGTAVLLEVARIIKSSDTVPKKSIIFAAFNGEESGMTGSQAYVSDPPYPLDKSVMLCLDMVGCSAEIPLTIATDESGAGKLAKELSKYAEELKINYTKSTLSGSDHSSFSQAGVDSVLLINEDWLNGYHSPEDTMEDVSKSNIEQAAKLVLKYIDNNAY